MTPIGPYVSQWCEKERYLISTLRHNEMVYAVVPNGTQAADTTLIFPTIREAKQWLTDNGFLLKE